MDAFFRRQCVICDRFKTAISRLFIRLYITAKGQYHVTSHATGSEFGFNVKGIL